MTMQTTNGANGALIERVVAMGDLDGLKPIERAHYYGKVCESVGLNPLTRPFAYIKLNGKLTLYALRDATDQLRKIHGVSVQIVSRERTDDLCVVTARATSADGRCDEAIGAVSIAGLKGENLANALMKAETKAKRRVTLSICGLGWLDETEVSDVKGARQVQVTADGEIVESGPDLTKQLEESVAQNWDKWLADAQTSMRTAASLMEAWTDVNDDIKRLKPPAHIVAAAIACKDELKGSR